MTLSRNRSAVAVSGRHTPARAVACGRLPRRRARGFTLLELLIGVIAFAVVLAAISSVFYAGLHLRNKTSEAIERSLPMEKALAIMKRDIANIVAPGGTFGGELQTQTSTNNSESTLMLAAEGERVSPEFVTTSAFVDYTSPWSEVQKVAYYLVASTNWALPGHGRDLVRFVSRNLLPVADDEPVQQWLMGGVENVTFTYYDGTAWQETWDSTTAETKLPVAIRMQIQLAPEEKDVLERAPVELVVPLLVSGGTNDTTQASGGGL